MFDRLNVITSIQCETGSGIASKRKRVVLVIIEEKLKILKMVKV